MAQCRGWIGIGKGFEEERAVQEQLAEPEMCKDLLEILKRRCVRGHGASTIGFFCAFLQLFRFLSSTAARR
jgi:hypothetical protein